MMKNRIKKSIIDEVWERVNIKDVFELLFPDVKLKRSGSYWICRCVFHEEKSPSLFIEPQFNKVHCFGCKTDLTLFKFVEEVKKCSFADAVIWLIENFCQDIDKSKIYEAITAEDERNQKIKETQIAYMSIVHQFYRDCYEGNTDSAALFRNYAEYTPENPSGRWDAAFCKSFGLGYAPNEKDALVCFARAKGLNLSILEDIGMIHADVDKNELRTGTYTDCFRGRLLIPQKDRWGNVVAYTGRNLTGSIPKYINNSCGQRNLIYKKRFFVFGMDVALNAATKAKKLYLVEGAPDAMRLYSLGIYNVVACIGGQWTQEQLQRFRFIGKLIFIPDADANTDIVEGIEVKRGESFVLDSAEKTLRLGFSVGIRSIPSDGTHKEDVDSYVTDLDKWNQLEDEDFILWYARLLYDNNASHEQQHKMLNKISDLLLCIADEGLRQSYLTTLKKSYSTATLWKTAIKQAEGRQHEEMRKLDMKESSKDLSCYPFHLSDGCFVSYGEHGKLEMWTNCDIDSLFLIEDLENPTRILRFTNGSISRVVEISQADVSTYARFQAKAEGFGNFRIKCGKARFEHIRDMICDFAEPTYRLLTMGFHADGGDGFYAQANGIQYKGKWIDVDEFGMVRVDGRCYFIPAYSIMYKDRPQIYQNMRRFTHSPERIVTMDEYFSLVEKAFGINGITGLTYCVATMFKDIIVNVTRFFPILFMYGRRSTGKTEYSITLSRLFQAEEEISNIPTTSAYSMAEKMEHMSNGLVTFDEYQEDTESEKRDLLKGSHDASGRTVRSGYTNERAKSAVPCGILITGNALPVQDPTLLSRMLYMEAHTSTRTSKEVDTFNKLKELRNKGVTCITLDMQRHRKNFAQNFATAWQKARKELKTHDVNNDIDERQIECWALLYATATCLEMIGVRMPFSRKRVLEASVFGMTHQYSVTKETQETGEFWNGMCEAVQNGTLLNHHDFKVVYITKKFDVTKDKHQTTLTSEMVSGAVLMLHSQRCIKKVIDVSGIRMSPLIMKKHLCDSLEYLGTGTQCTSFTEVDMNGMPKKRMVIVGDQTVERGVYRTNKPLVFDYEYLKKVYGVDLEVHTGLDEYTMSNLKDFEIE